MISEEDLAFGESIGVTAAIIVLLIVFGAIVAGLLPLLMTVMFTLPITLGIVGLFGALWDFSFFTPNLISMMGIAVGVDYALFIVSRYREERHNGREKHDAIRASGATASRAVFFSGLTVVVALAGMLLVPTTIFRSLAGGAIIVVLVSVASSMTLLPAVLSLLGDRVNWPYLSRVPTLLVFIAMLAGRRAWWAACSAAAGASAVGADRRARRLRRAWASSSTAWSSEGRSPATRGRKAPASAARAASGTASPAWSWAARWCGSRSAARS